MDALALAVREMQHASRQFNVALARRLGLNATDITALDVMLAEGPVGPAALAARLGITTASATALVDRLEAMGHVQRHPDAVDRRRIAVAATQHAVDEVFEVLRPAIRDMTELGRQLTPEQRNVVLAYLRAATKIMMTHADRGTGT